MSVIKDLLFIKDSYSLNGISKLKMLGISKAGNPSWLGEYNGKKVKVYKCFSEKQAEFIQWVSNKSELSKYFPDCYFVKGKFVFCEWVDGKEFSVKDFSKENQKIKELKVFLDKLHALKVDDFFNLEQDIYANFIKKRVRDFDCLQKFNSNLELKNVILKISHPDLTAKNVIYTESGFKVIDNEFLAVSSCSDIDFYNFIANLDMKRISKDVKDFLKSSIKIDKNNLEILEKLWKLRLQGGLLQSGRIKEAVKINEIKENMLQSLMEG